jgi:hypothetical protein
MQNHYNINELKCLPTRLFICMCGNRTQKFTSLVRMPTSRLGFKSMQLTLPKAIYLSSILILANDLRRKLSNGYYPSRVPTNILCTSLNIINSTALNPSSLSACWCSSNALYLYSKGARQESRTGHWLSRQLCRGLSSVLPEKCQDSNSIRPQPLPFKFIIHQSSYTVCNIPLKVRHTLRREPYGKRSLVCSARWGF